MIKEVVFKMPFETNHYNNNQKVFVQSMSGSQAALVSGRFKGKGRYVESWVSWSAKDRESPRFINIKQGL